MTLLAAWLVGLTAVFAWLGSRFYQRQMESSNGLERMVLQRKEDAGEHARRNRFVDPTLAAFFTPTMPLGAWQNASGPASGRDVTEITYDDVKIAPSGAIDRVLTFGTPFHLTEHPLKDETGVTHFLDINLLRLQGAQETIQGVLYLVEDKTRDVTLRQELIAANAAKDQFLALLSHELRSPSRVLRWWGSWKLKCQIPSLLRSTGGRSA
jgi:signal transduction histidine kinase